jgi:hypothetical protein
MRVPVRFYMSHVTISYVICIAAFVLTIVTSLPTVQPPPRTPPLLRPFLDTGAIATEKMSR